MNREDFIAIGLRELQQYRRQNKQLRKSLEELYRILYLKTSEWDLTAITALRAASKLLKSKVK